MRWRSACALACACVISSCGGAAVAAPPTIAATEPAPLPPSRIDTFLRIPLSALEAAAETSVPRAFAREPYSLVLQGTEADPVVAAGYRFERDGFDLEVESGRLVLRTTLAYWIRARRTVGFIEVPGSCGVDEARRHMRLAISVDADVTDDFSLAPSLRLVELTPLDRCEMSFAGIDVTERVRQAIADELSRELPALRERIRTGVDLRGKVLAAFERMGRPVPLDDGATLSMDPEAAGISRPVVEGHNLRIGLALRAHPSVRMGAAPTTSAGTVPTRIEPAAEPSIDLVVPVRVSAEHMQAMLAEEFQLSTGGLRYPPAGRRFIRPTAVTLSAYGDSLVARIAFTGFADGVFYLRGRPHLDPATSVLSSEDLDFTLESRSVLLRIASAVRDDELRTELRRRVRLELRDVLERTRLRLTDALRQQVEGVALEGAIDTLDLLEARTDPVDGALVLVLRARGRVSAQYIGD